MPSHNGCWIGFTIHTYKIIVEFSEIFPRFAAKLYAGVIPVKNCFAVLLNNIQIAQFCRIMVGENGGDFVFTYRYSDKRFQKMRTDPMIRHAENADKCPVESQQADHD